MSGADASALVETKCLNCGALVQDTYCPRCGQKAGAPPLQLHDFVHEVAHEFLHFDSKIWQTLRLLLFSPGALTKAYVAGQRIRYVGPVRLFLVSSLLLFGLLALLPGAIEVNEKGGADRSAIEAELAAATAEGGAFGVAMRQGALRIMHDPEHFRHMLLQAVSKSIFLLVPLFAFLTWKMFKRERPHYVAHLYFSLHFYAFVFVVLAAASTLAAAGPFVGSIAMIVSALVLLVYFYAAIRRSFEPSWARTLAGGTVILLGYLTLNGVAVLAILIATVLLL